MLIIQVNICSFLWTGRRYLNSWEQESMIWSRIVMFACRHNVSSKPFLLMLFSRLCCLVRTAYETVFESRKGFETSRHIAAPGPEVEKCVLRISMTPPGPQHDNDRCHVSYLCSTDLNATSSIID
ncbi:hypothetical protein LINGRAHAP2_LOCUS27058 [Linum grandiflorum]